mgnify:CR=1 FL=1
MSSSVNETKTMRSAMIKRIFFLGGELLLGMFVLLFSAGSWSYSGAWILGGLYLFSNLMFGLLLPRKIIEHRSTRKKNVPVYEKIIGMLSWIIGYGVYVVAGLDQRLAWSLPIPWFMYALAIFIFVMGMGIVLWSMIENPYFSTRVEKDEDHLIISSGPYQVIRHPGYLGMMTYLAVVPIILGSLYAMIPTIIILVLCYIRMRFEDNFLKKNLKGYIDYQQHVKHRLFRTFK